MDPAANKSARRAGRRFRSKIPKIVPKMLLLFTFDDPSRGSRTSENRPWPTSFTWPISSEATWATSFDSRRASTNRSFIQTSSSSCCSPYTLRVAAGSRRIGSSCRIGVARPAIRDNKRPRSRSTLPACSASGTSLVRRASVLDVPSLEVVLEFLFASVEVPPGRRVPMREIRQGLEVCHSLRPDVGHLGFEGVLPERILPDRTARQEPRGPSVAREPDEPPEHIEVRSRAQDDPRNLRRAAQPFAVLPQLIRVRRHLRVPREFRLQHVEPEWGQDLGRPDDRVRLLMRELLFACVDRIGHRLADERDVEAATLVPDGRHDLQLVVPDLPRRTRIEEQQELRGARPESFHLLHGPTIEEGREPPVPLLLVPRLLQGHEQARAARQDKSIDRGSHSKLRVEQVPARVWRQGLRHAELDGLHLRIAPGLRVLRMDHLLEAPPLVHRDHRETTRVVRNLLEAAELADRNPHGWHLGGSQRFGPILTFCTPSSQGPNPERTSALASSTLFRWPLA